MMPVEEITFEKALDRLEGLIAELEKGELSLEDSLKKFKEGTDLTRHCRKLLVEAEYRVEKILQDGETGDFELPD